MGEYKMLLVKIGVDMEVAVGSKTNAAVVINFALLSDIEVLLPLTCFILM